VIAGTGTLTARALTFIPATASERRDGTMGGSTRLLLRLKDVIRKHPSWDDSQVARRAGAIPSSTPSWCGPSATTGQGRGGAWPQGWGSVSED
jgi:hypothetical protein